MKNDIILHNKNYTYRQSNTLFLDKKVKQSKLILTANLNHKLNILDKVLILTSRGRAASQEKRIKYIILP